MRIQRAYGDVAIMLRQCVDVGSVKLGRVGGEFYQSISTIAGSGANAKSTQ